MFYVRSFRNDPFSIVTRGTIECLACQHIDILLFNEFIQILGHVAYDKLACTPNKVSSYQILII